MDGSKTKRDVKNELLSQYDVNCLFSFIEQDRSRGRFKAWSCQHLAAVGMESTLFHAVMVPKRYHLLNVTFAVEFF